MVKGLTDILLRSHTASPDKGGVSLKGNLNSKQIQLRFDQSDSAKNIMNTGKFISSLSSGF